MSLRAARYVSSYVEYERYAPEGVDRGQHLDPWLIVFSEFDGTFLYTILMYPGMTKEDM